PTADVTQPQASGQASCRLPRWELRRRPFSLCCQLSGAIEKLTIFLDVAPDRRRDCRRRIGTSLVYMPVREEVTMPTWTLDWSRGPLTIELPARNVGQAIEPPELPTLGTPVELVERALERPIGSPPLEEMVRPGDRVALLVTDWHDRIVGQEGVGQLI